MQARHMTEQFRQHIKQQAVKAAQDSLLYEPDMYWLGAINTEEHKLFKGYYHEEFVRLAELELDMIMGDTDAG